MIFIYLALAFLFGIIFIQWIIPFIDGILNLILTQLEVWKGYMAVKITKYQSQVSEIKQSVEENDKSSLIGFIALEDK